MKYFFSQVPTAELEATADPGEIEWHELQPDERAEDGIVFLRADHGRPDMTTLFMLVPEAE